MRVIWRHIAVAFHSLVGKDAVFPRGSIVPGRGHRVNGGGVPRGEPAGGQSPWQGGIAPLAQQPRS